MSARLAFHYTSGHKLQPILESGELQPSKLVAPGELPLLWFSTNDWWEPTANKGISTPTGSRLLTTNEQREIGGCFRFVIDVDHVPLMPWAEACRFARTPYAIRKRMERHGIQRGGYPHQWFACARAVSLADCIAFERMDDAGKWQLADLLQMADWQAPTDRGN